MPENEHYPITEWPSSPSIVDDVLDLLDPLPVARRWGVIAYLSLRYYDGWRPCRDEVADLIAVDSGLISLDDYITRTARHRAASETTSTHRPPGHPPQW